MTTTPTSGAADLPDLIEAYAEARHRQGHSSYNAQTATTLQAVKDALAQRFDAAPAQPAAEASRFGSPELQAMIIARCVEKDQAESVYAFRRKGLEDFCTCDEARYEELSNKPHLFETRVLYTAPQPSPTTQAASVQEDAARLDFIQECGATVEILPGRLGWTFRVGGLHGGVHGSVRAAIDAERQAFRKQGASRDR